MPLDATLPDTFLTRHPSIRGLCATPTAPLPFLDGVVVRSFILERPQGNVIVYNSPGISAAKRDILALGVPDRLLVTHWHEGMYAAPDIDVDIFVHEDDRTQTNLPIAGTFTKREKIANDLEVIPTPGHTLGTTMFLWDNGQHRLLFPGDSIWVSGGDWKAVLLDERSRETYIASINVVMDLDFDILVPWGAEEQQPHFYQVTHEQARRNLQRIAERLQNGESA